MCGTHSLGRGEQEREEEKGNGREGEEEVEGGTRSPSVSRWKDTKKFNT